MQPFIYFVSVVISIQSDASPSIYATENIWNTSGISTKVDLVRLAFDKDMRVTKETLIKGERSVFGHSLRTRFLLDNRYVITGSGGVIDVQAKKVLHDMRYGTLLGAENGKVIFLVADIDMPNGVFAFDLKKQTVERLERPGHWNLLGVKSPDNKMSIKQEASGGRVLLHHADGTVDRVAEGFRVTYGQFASPHLGGLPFLWLDNERVLTQEANGELLILDVKGKQQKLLSIEAEHKGTLAPPLLDRDAAGRIIYTANERYVIDVKAKKATKMERAVHGHGFEIAPTVDAKKLRAVFHDGKEIGRWHLLEYQTRTAPGVIAFPYAEPGGNLGYPKGIAVWQAKTGQWQTIDFAVGDVIGWGK